MPCRSDYLEPTPGERAATTKLRKEVEALGDRLTAAMDVLREYLLGNEPVTATLTYVNIDAGREYVALREQNDKLYVKVAPETMAKVNGMCSEYHDLNTLVCRMEPPTKKELEQVRRAQVKHREEDLRRLMKTFGQTADRERLAKVLAADNTKPLEPQLGFSPDEF